MYKGPETRDVWPCQGSAHPQDLLVCGPGLSQKASPKEVLSKLRPTGEDAVIKEITAEKGRA